MAKQIFIDGDGNEVPVSGTVNSADMLPISASDDTKVSEAIDEVNEFINHLSNKYVIGGKKQASGITRVNFGVTFSSAPVVSVIPLNSTSPQTYLRSCALVSITTTYFEFVEIAIQNGSSTLINGSDDCVWIAVGNKA